MQIKYSIVKLILICSIWSFLINTGQFHYNIIPPLPLKTKFLEADQAD